MAWQSWNPKDSVAAKTVTAVENALSPIVGTMESILQAVKAVVEFVSTLIRDIPDLETAPLKAAIETIRAIVEDLTGGAGCYFLPIPMHLKNVVAEDALIFDPTPGGGEVSDVTNVLLPPVGGGGGGNYGLLRDVIESLADQNDIMRPQFDEDTHVAGVVVVAGANTYLDLIPLIKKLKRLLSGKNNSGAGEGIATSDGASLPRVKNLRAEIAPAAVGQLQKLQNRKTGGESTHPYAVKLSWDLPERITVITLGSRRYSHTVEKVVVFRSETPVSISTSPETLQASKLKDFTFDGLVSEFYDDSIELGKTYYYAVGYETSVKVESLSDSGGSSETTLSAVADAVTDIYVPTEITMLPRNGVPPDWLLFGNPLALIPNITEIVDNINAFLDALEKRIDDKSKKFKEYVRALEREIDRYIAFADSVIGTIREIVELLDFPDVYIGAYPFKGKGGNTFFIHELGKALTNTNDPHRPPFDRGDEIVTGFILYAGSTTVGKLQAFTSFVEMLLGSATSSAEQAYAEAAAAINYAVDEIEREICLLKNLEKGVCPTEEEEKVSPLGPNLASAEENSECQQ